MAIIYICDGCGVQSNSREAVFRIGVGIFEGTEENVRWKATPNAEYDLCPNCRTRLVEVANPRTWPRASEDLSYKDAIK